MSPIEVNRQWIAKGNTGCCFATLFAKDPQKIGWSIMEATEKLEIPKNSYLVSIVFKDKTVQEVKGWALENGFYIAMVYLGISTLDQIVMFLLDRLLILCYHFVSNYQRHLL